MGNIRFYHCLEAPIADQPAGGRPLVAIVGRPNVGKSTLFNRFVGRRLAIVEDMPGTTRDRLVAAADWLGVEFDVVDTGGLGVADVGAIGVAVANQVKVALAEAVAIVMVVDVVDGPTGEDEAAADLLRRSGKPVVLAANKADNEARRLEVSAFWNLGLGEPLPVSALHGSGSGDVLDRVVAILGNEPTPEQEDDGALRVAIVGRPNVGKSSLVNKLLGSERVIVTDVPGTTRDPIDTALDFAGRRIVLIDTAGIRRRGRVEPGIEKYSVLRAMRVLQRADVAVVVIDAVDGITAQDTHIAGAVSDAGVGAILAVNKWDLIEKDSFTADETFRVMRERLKFLDYAPLVLISALTGQRTSKVLELAMAVDEERRTRIPTGELNRLVADVQARHNPPSKSGRALRIYYATQVAVAPPTFMFFVNDPELAHFTYRRFVENQLRRSFPFQGSPVRLVFRPRGDD